MSIIGFSVVFLLVALANLFDGLGNISATQFQLDDRMPWVEWTHDLTVVSLFARFTIALIPVVLIYFFASRVARWLVVLFGIYQIMPYSFDLQLIMLSIELRPALLVPPIITLLALAMLFTPEANRWFSQRGTSDGRTPI